MGDFSDSEIQYGGHSPRCGETAARPIAITLIMTAGLTDCAYINIIRGIGIETVKVTSCRCTHIGV